GQIFCLLRGAAVAADLVDAQVRVRAVGQPHRSGGAADFLHRHDMGEITHLRAAVLLLHGDPEQAQIAHLLPEVGRELVAAVDLGGARRNFGGGELLHRGAQHVDGLAEMKIERRKVRHGQCPGPPAMTMSVCCMIAHSVRPRAPSAYTSPRVMASVRPGLATCASATKRSPCAGAMRLSLYSTVSTPASSGKRVKAA